MAYLGSIFFANMGCMGGQHCFQNVVQEGQGATWALGRGIGAPGVVTAPALYRAQQQEDQERSFPSKSPNTLPDLSLGTFFYMTILEDLVPFS